MLFQLEKSRQQIGLTATFSLGVQNGAFWVGGQKVYVEKLYVLFLSPKRASDQHVCFSKGRSIAGQALEALSQAVQAASGSAQSPVGTLEDRAAE